MFKEPYNKPIVGSDRFFKINGSPKIMPGIPTHRIFSIFSTAFQMFSVH